MSSESRAYEAGWDACLSHLRATGDDFAVRALPTAPFRHTSPVGPNCHQPSMIWVHGPRYLPVMYPDHEKPDLRAARSPGATTSRVRAFKTSSGTIRIESSSDLEPRLIKGAAWSPPDATYVSPSRPASAGRVLDRPHGSRARSGSRSDMLHHGQRSGAAAPRRGTICHLNHRVMSILVE